MVEAGGQASLVGGQRVLGVFTRLAGRVHAEIIGADGFDVVVNCNNDGGLDLLDLQQLLLQSRPWQSSNVPSGSVFPAEKS